MQVKLEYYYIGTTNQKSVHLEIRQRLEIDRPHSTQTSHQHHKTSPQTEPIGKEKGGKATKHPPSRSREGCKEDRPHMGAAGETHKTEKAGEN
jgi:hypothetical protein